MSNAQRCAIMCGEGRFQAFLRFELSEPGVKDGLDKTPDWLPCQTAEQAAHAARYLLSVTSRRDLDQTKHGALKLQYMLSRYEAWKRDLI